MTISSADAALRVLALINSPLLEPGQHDAYEALTAADAHKDGLSGGEKELVNIAWSLYRETTPLGFLDAANTAAVLRILADRYAPEALTL
jgi:ABC-type phosphate/phosphonate transport system ATPase subunit